MNAPGGIIPQLGVLPAGERLAADHGAAVRVDDRLVVDHDLVGLQRVTQV
jgi:hypothetical protein